MIKNCYFNEKGVAFAYLLDRADTPKKRSRVYLCVSDGILTVRLPYRMTEAQALDIIRQKLGWISKKLTDKPVAPDDDSGTYGAGDSIVLFGGLVKTRDIPGTSDLSADELKLWLDRYVREEFSRKLSERLLYWREVTGLHPTKVSVRTMKSRWGSCSAEGHLSFNLRLARYPVEVLDSVIVHELCHLKHLDHSKAFWNEVYRYCPEYAGLRKQLVEGRWERLGQYRTDV